MLSKKKILAFIASGAVATTAVAAIPLTAAEAPSGPDTDTKAGDASKTEQVATADKKRDERQTSAIETGKGGAANERRVKDAWLDGKLETALLLNTELNSFAIDTKVSEGVAHLGGEVESSIDRDLAEEIAQSVGGIDKVENDLSVVTVSESIAENQQNGLDRRFIAAVENATLTARIKSEFLLNQNISGMTIAVDSRSDVVTLSGSVASEGASELAEQIAQNAAGQRKVRNKLSIDANS